MYRLSRSFLFHPSFSGIAKLIPVRQVANYVFSIWKSLILLFVTLTEGQKWEPMVMNFKRHRGPIYK